MATNSFEKVMQACLESKKAPAKKTVSANKAPAKKVTEKKVTRKAVREAEEDYFDTINDAGDPEAEYDVVDTVDVIDNEVDDDVVDDVADDIVVVVDPEIDATDIDTVASELQDIIDETPEGEIPTTDEYVDDLTYSCPICGSTFFTPEEMKDGDECPVCAETPEAFVLVGQVAEAGEDEEAPVEDEVDVDVTVDDGGEDLEADVAEDDLEADVEDSDEEDKAAEEAYRRARARAQRARTEMRRPVSRTRRPATRKAEMRKPANRRPATKRTAPKFTGYQLDESTFNPFMTKFIRENYKNARAYAMKSATYNKARKALKVECVITMKNGSKKRSVLTFEGFNPNSRALLAKDTTNTFKCEGRTAPFRFAVRKVGNTIKCEGLKYNYVTKSLKEGRLQFSGNLARENRKPSVNRSRAMEASRRARASRPMPGKKYHR